MTYFPALVVCSAKVRARFLHVFSGDMGIIRSVALVRARIRRVSRRGLLGLVVLLSGTWLATPAVAWEWPWHSEEAAPGTPDWWKQHKRKDAVFEVGKGWKVEGTDGYFDDDGRPIAGPVAVERIIKADDEGDPSEGLVPGLDPRVQYSKVKEAVGLGPNEELARAAYVEGDRLFREKDYKGAAKQFSEAASRGPNMPMEQDALFMLAESYFYGDRYMKARDSYDALVKKHPNTRYMDRLIAHEWEIAQFWEKYEEYNPDWPMTPNAYDKSRPWFDTRGHAIKTYENIRLNDPTGPRADDAIMATANIYFKHAKFEEADTHYTLLRREYPRSEFQFEAHLLGLQSKLRKYQGPDYDGTPLEEAKVLVKQLRQQFSGRLSQEERERLKTVEAQLNLQIAARDMEMAAYYDKTKHYGSARYYYAELQKKYPGSELAGKAQERVAALEGKPDNPPQRLAWLLDMVPESGERSRVANIPEVTSSETRLAEAPTGTTATAPPTQSPETTNR